MRLLFHLILLQLLALNLLRLHKSFVLFLEQCACLSGFEQRLLGLLRLVADNELVILSVLLLNPDKIVEVFVTLPRLVANHKGTTLLHDRLRLLVNTSGGEPFDEEGLFAGPLAHHFLLNNLLLDVLQISRQALLPGGIGHSELHSLLERHFNRLIVAKALPLRIDRVDGPARKVALSDEPLPVHLVFVLL